MPARVPGSQPGSIAVGIFDNPALDEVLMVALIIVVVIIEVYEYYAPDPSALRNKKEACSSSYGNAQTVRTKVEDGRASTEFKGGQYCNTCIVNCLRSRFIPVVKVSILSEVSIYVILVTENDNLSVTTYYAR